MGNPVTTQATDLHPTTAHRHPTWLDFVFVFRVTPGTALNKNRHDQFLMSPTSTHTKIKNQKHQPMSCVCATAFLLRFTMSTLFITQSASLVANQEFLSQHILFRYTPVTCLNNNQHTRVTKFSGHTIVNKAPY